MLLWHEYSPGLIRSWRFDLATRKETALPGVTKGPDLVASTLPGDFVLGRHRGIWSSPSEMLYRWPLTNPARVEVWKVKLPAGYAVRSFATSRDGKHVAWELDHIPGWTGAPNPNPSLHPMMSLTDGNDVVAREIWLSDLRGKGLRRIATLRHQPDDPPTLGELGWVPGGRGVSFIFKDRLYLLPID